MFKIKSQHEIIDFRSFNIIRQRMWRTAWEKAIADFLTAVMDRLPVLHGGTKRAFENVVSKFGANMGDMSMMSSYVVWKGWEHKHFKEYAQVEYVFDFEIRGLEVKFEITGFPDTFEWNDQSRSQYVQYWTKGKLPWSDRVPHGPVGEPWEATDEPGEKMRIALYAAGNRIMTEAVRETLKVSMRRGRG